MLRVSAMALVCLSLAAPLCRFTVRDVGFVDLGDPKYTLYTFASKADSPAAHASLERMASAVFGETNVDVEMIDPDSETENDAHRFLRELEIQEFPTSVLVHPDGHALEVPFPGEISAAGGETLESIVRSPARTAITEGVLRRYCVVLLVEGQSTEENERVKSVVLEAFSEIERVFDRMPKAVGELPELIALPREQQAAERVLLWSLGLESEPSGEDSEPHVAVLFGRGRRFGPILDGDGITKSTVLGILANAGQSCECELDRSWMRGPRVPLRWDDDIKQKAVDLLGFDPENPLVKSEISGILARGPKGKTGENAEPTVADLLGSYTEEAVEPEESTLRAGSTEVQNGGQAPIDGAAGTSSSDDSGDGSDWTALFWTLGLICALSIGTAAVVIMRTQRA